MIFFIMMGLGRIFYTIFLDRFWGITILILSILHPPHQTQGDEATWVYKSKLKIKSIMAKEAIIRERVISIVSVMSLR